MRSLRCPLCGGRGYGENTGESARGRKGGRERGGGGGREADEDQARICKRARERKGGGRERGREGGSIGDKQTIPVQKCSL